jgi:serine/threonine-protein kinase
VQATLAECPICGCPLGQRTDEVEGRLLRNGEFRLLRKLGGGGMGSLYLGSATATGGLRVVKELRTPTNRKVRGTFETMFDQEARLLARLSQEHTAVPRFYDSFMDSGSFYIILEFIPGQNLHEYMHEKGGQLSITETVDIAAQVADVLAVIHSLRPPVIHGDIKPSNLVRRPDGRIVLIDFGLARMDISRPSFIPTTGSAFGTPGYTPLEQWEGHPSPASDIFAFGATLHQLVSGRNPRAAFAHLSQVSLSELASLTTFPPITLLVPETPPMLETLLTAMVRRRPIDRPTTADVKTRLTRLQSLYGGAAGGQ